MGVNPDNPCPKCGSIYSDNTMGYLWACRRCGAIYDNSSRKWDDVTKEASPDSKDTNIKISDLLEDLEITRAPWEVMDKHQTAKLVELDSIRCNEYSGYPVIIAYDDRVNIYEKDLNVILASPEMLSELIAEWKFLESFLGENASKVSTYWHTEFLKRQESLVSKIAKALDKHTNEVEELLREI